MPDYIALYRAYLEQEKHASPNTVSSYVRDLTQFRAWLPQGSDLRRVKPAAVEEYLAHLTDQGRSAATVTRSAASIKSFYHYLVLSGAMKASPAKDVAAAKVVRQLRKYKTKVIDRKLRAVDETIRTEPVPTKDLDQLMEELAADEEVVRVKEIEFEPLTEEEALVKIDLLGHDFFAYTDRDTNMVNVLYRRDDGGYGLLKQREEA